MIAWSLWLVVVGLVTLPAFWWSLPASRRRRSACSSTRGATPSWPWRSASSCPARRPGVALDGRGPAAASRGCRRRRPGRREARVSELTATRAGAVDAAAAELQRIERDLHDGAQARLVALAHRPRPGRGALRARPGGRPELIERRARGGQARRSRSCATSHAASTPACSTTAAWMPPCPRSPPAAPLPARSTVRRTRPRRRRRSRSAAYFVVAEALDQRGQARRRRRAPGRASARDRPPLRAEVRRRRHRRRRPGRRTGLTGLRPRVAPLDGTLTVTSPVGGPTVIRRGVPVRVVIAEDLALLRDGLTRLLQRHRLRGRGRRRRRRGAARRGRGAQAGRRVVDVRMPPASATRACARRSRRAGGRPGCRC